MPSRAKVAKADHVSSPLQKRRPWLIALFGWYLRRFLARHFHRVRVSRDSALRQLPAGPVIIAINHPSWWDPLVAMLLASRLGDRRHVAPIEASALERYRFFESLGLFGIESGTAGGMRRLLRVAKEVFRHRDGVFWITPQGTFADVRRRPLALRPRVGMLAQRLQQGTVLPIAVEYPFWNDRLPEVLIRFGEPIPIVDGRQREARQWAALIEARLTETQNALSEQAISRDPRAFETLLDGRSGVSWIYDLWRRCRAWWHGETFQLEHDGMA